MRLFRLMNVKNVQDTKYQTQNQKWCEVETVQYQNYISEAEGLRQYYVDSSNVKWAAYSEDFGRFYVQFISGGRLVVYFDVPPEVWQGFQNAESKGTFIYDEIRGAKGRRADKSRGIPAPSLDYLYAYVNLK
mgnify:CR=1 FL=1